MTKQETKEVRVQEVKTPFYMRAAFPWLIIGLMAALTTGLIAGWTLRSDQEANIAAQVNSKVASLKTEQ